MKKNIIAIGITFLLTGAHLTKAVSIPKTKEEVINNYKKAVERIITPIPKDKFFFVDKTKETQKKQQLDCEFAANDIILFVDSHSKNLLGKQDTLLLNTAEQLKSLTTEAVSIIMSSLNKLYPQNPKPKNIVAEEIKKLNTIENKIKNCYDKISKELFTIPDKRESRDVLKSSLSNLLYLVKWVSESAGIIS